MKTNRRKFIIIFVISAFVFIGATNLLLHPVNGDWYAGTNSPIAWQRNLAAVIYPIKVILVGPLAPVLNDPDPAPPIRAIACAIYWTAIAFVLHFLLSLVIPRKKA